MDFLRRKIEKDYMDKYGLKNHYFSGMKIKEINNYTLKSNYGYVFIDLIATKITGDDLFLYILLRNLIDAFTVRYIFRWVGTEIDYKSVKQRIFNLDSNHKNLDLFMAFVIITNRDFYSKNMG